MLQQVSVERWLLGASLRRRLRVVLAFFVAMTLSDAGSAGGAEAMQRVLAGDCKAAGEEINEGIARADPAAYMMAGYLYDATGCVDHDPARAAKYYLRATELGDQEAPNFLGLMYGLGNGVQQDYREAYRYFVLSSKNKPEFNPVPEDHEPASGYARTVTQLARARANVTNPRFYTDATIMVTFDVASRSLYIETAGIERASVFRQLITDAYDEAMKRAPPLEPAFPQDFRFKVPWTFSLR